MYILCVFLESIILNLLLVYFLSHHVGPEYHTSPEIVINRTRASGVVNDGNHVMVVVKRDFSYI